MTRCRVCGEPVHLENGLYKDTDAKIHADVNVSFCMSRVYITAAVPITVAAALREHLAPHRLLASGSLSLLSEQTKRTILAQASAFLEAWRRGTRIE